MDPDMDDPVYCLNCRQRIAKADLICQYCGRDQRLRTAPETGVQPAYQPETPAWQYFPPPGNQPLPDNQRPPDMELIELGRQYQSASGTKWVTFWFGLFCLWPLWIWTYVEHSKMETIKARVAAKGINPYEWINSLNRRRY